MIPKGDGNQINVSYDTKKINRLVKKQSPNGDGNSNKLAKYSPLIVAVVLN